MENNQKNNLATPISIIIGSIIIALAILISNKGGNNVKEMPSQPTQVKAETIDQAVKALGINTKQFNECIASDKYVASIDSSIKEAQSTGGGGTPWSIVVTKSGKKYPLSGAQSIEKVKELIEQALKDEVATTDKKLDNLAPVTAADHIRGDINAPVKIVEFSDIDCPFCKKFHTTMQEVMKTYGKDGKVAWVYRHLPLTQLHPDAKNKAEASECVTEIGGKDKFWAFVDRLSK